MSSSTESPVAEPTQYSATPVANRIGVLILQHPQEQDQALGTARLTTECLANATLRIGLSWPSLSKALGRAADSRRWAILHLGSVRRNSLPHDREVIAVDRNGAPVIDQDRALTGIEGVVLFDGTWSQAKTLWWRNAWVLKGQRVVLNPRQPSLYGKLRREPRREGLSTIEATGLILSRLEGRPDIEATLRDAFAAMLGTHRTAQGA